MKKLYSILVSFFLISSLSAQNSITFSVDMNEYTDTFTTVFVAGTFNNFAQFDNPLDDSDGDGIWEATIDVPNGEMEFKYQLDGWVVEENLIDGDVCTKTSFGAGGEKFVNRVMNVTGDEVLSTVCWSRCVACGEEDLVATVNFQVDMRGYTGSEYGQGVTLNGNFNNFCGACAPMSDADGDTIWELSVAVPRGDSIQYKFTLGNFADEEFFVQGDPCTVTSFGASQEVFTNRVAVINNDTTLPAVCFEACVTCDAVGIASNRNAEEVSIYPNPATNNLFLSNLENRNVRIQLISISGQVVDSWNSNGKQNMELNLDGISEGVYFIKLFGESETTRKVVILD